MLSLCMIMRNEEDFLPECLASVRGVVDEVVICDTGSTDRSVEIAKAAGAKVVHRPWEDDFAAPRNAALDAASGDWVLLLDADERLSRGSKAALKKAIRRDDFELGMLPLHHATTLDATDQAVLSGAKRKGKPVALPRLFRRSPTLRWEGKVHETPHSWLCEGRRGRIIKADIIHLGMVQDVIDGRNKGKRNLDLLEARCVDEPNSVVAWGHLAGERMVAHGDDSAWEATERGWATLDYWEDRPPRPSVIRLATMRFVLHLKRGQIKELLREYKRIENWGMPHPNLEYLYAMALEMDGRSADAVEVYERARTLPGPFLEDVMPDAVGERCRLLRDVAAVHAVVAEDPARAMQMVEALLVKDVPDPWVLAAMACSHLGELDDLKGFVYAALKHKQDFLVPRRRLDMMELAAEVALYERLPVALTGRLEAIGALITRTPWPKEPIDPEGLERVAVNLLRLNRVQDVEPLLEPRADGVAPGLRSRIRHALGRLSFSNDDDRPSDPNLGA